jgi:hypothetical protein
MVLEEFQTWLTPREQWFFHEYLVQLPQDDAGPSLSPSSRRKLKQRVLRKLRRFLAIDEAMRPTQRESQATGSLRGRRGWRDTTD